jgi:hypothetical protein
MGVGGGVPASADAAPSALAAHATGVAEGVCLGWPWALDPQALGGGLHRPRPADAGSGAFEALEPPALATARVELREAEPEVREGADDTTCSDELRRGERARVNPTLEATIGWRCLLGWTRWCPLRAEVWDESQTRGPPR